MCASCEEIIEDIYVHRYCFYPQYYTQESFRNIRDVFWRDIGRMEQRMEAEWYYLQYVNKVKKP
jgi:hypothetical protein